MKAIPTIFILLILSNSYSQQQFTGLTSDNFAGYSTSFNNPASIVNTTNRFSLNSSFVNLNSNNFLGANTSLISLIFGNEQERYREHLGAGYLMRNTSIDVLNAYFEINHHNSIGYSFRIRQFGNIDGLPNELTAAKDNNYDDSKPLNTPIDFSLFNFNQFIYNEHRFHYANVIKDDDSPHFFKAGIAFKLINGIDATYLYAEEGSFEFTDNFNSVADFSDVEFRYGRAEKDNSFSSRNLGFGLDLGVEYEFRPNKGDFLYDMDGETDIERFDKKKYKYKIGASIVDIGRVRFAKDPNSFDFINTGSPIDAEFISSLGTGLFAGGGLFKDFDNFAGEGSPLPDNEENFNMNLPTIFSVQVDYHLKGKFYLNWTSAFPLMRRRDPHKVHLKSVHSITPRYETNRVSVMLPLTFQRNAQFNVGFAVRWNVLDEFGIFLGSSNISGAFGKRSSYTSNIFTGLTFNLPYKVPKDTDGDKVSDAKDRCKYDPGPWELEGCPDTDGDGIIDIEDHCIYDPGPVEHRGCPDRDGDGIIDINDQCPDEPGLPIHYGCPDRDRDGVIDIVDQCPDEPGLELNNGCPFEMPKCCIDDRDGDGVPDEEDECPDVPGSIYNRGCPIDSTNLEQIDLPERRREKDPNHTDKYIDDIQQDQEEKGVDRLDEEAEMIVEDYQSSKTIERLNVYFNFDESTLTEEYDKQIIELVEKYGNKYRFVVIGHTDHRGSETYNLILSKRRAEVVSRKLKTNNVKEDDIDVFYYGEWKPKRSNDNKVGRKFNRRVEIFVEPR